MKLFTCLLILSCHLVCGLEVLVTLPPFGYYVEQIGGDFVDVKSLLPVGASPHEWEPTPQQVKQALAAKIWFQSGEPVESRVPAPKMTKIDLRKGLDLVKGCPHCGNADLHYWLSVKEAKIFSQTIANALIAAMPENKAEIEKNLHNLMLHLGDVNMRLEQKLKPCLGETILVSHPAFTYFCRDYGLHQLSLEQEGKEPTSRQLLRVIDQAKKEKVKLMIVEQQFNPKAAMRVAAELGLRMCTIDPVAKDPIETMNALAECVCQQSR